MTEYDYDNEIDKTNEDELIIHLLQKALDITSTEDLEEIINSCSQTIKLMTNEDIKEDLEKALK